MWGAKDLWEVYDNVSPGWTGRCTAPLLVDRKEKRIISNEVCGKGMKSGEGWKVLAGSWMSPQPWLDRPLHCAAAGG